MKVKILLLRDYLVYSLFVFRQLKKGQKVKYNLLQLSHRLEKGMTLDNPKKLWGWDKAQKIASLLKHNTDVFSNETASAVLSSFLEMKTHSTDCEDLRLADEFIAKTGFIPTDFRGNGGIQTVDAQSFSNSDIAVCEKLFYSRHSVWDFSDKPVSRDVIYRAVEMAQRCPSACNRQPYKCYVVDAKTRREKLPSLADYNADKYMVITGDIRAFVTSEFNDRIVSPVIFASYLTLSLHLFGVGSCVMKKQLLSDTPYNYSFRRLANIEDGEIIILELAIGYYKNQYVTPVSNRADASEMVRFVEDK